jgi:tRNA threonylcarbamoyladenosine biosynthesis protein TsaB
MKLLAFDTSTERMSIAVQRGTQRWLHDGAGGAQASTQMLPQIGQLMAQAGLAYAELDAIVFGRGPGSFTGLRTACAVAQGLAFGADVQLLPVDSLLAVAKLAQTEQPQARAILATLDARMNQVYAKHYYFDSTLSNEINGGEQNSTEISLVDVDQLQHLLLMHPAAPAPVPALLAGNLRPALDAQLAPEILALPHVSCVPTAAVLLDLAPALIAAGQLVPPELALPVYIRDKVAFTTAERQAK